VKIVNLIHCTNLGGMEQASLRLMQTLRARGHQVEVLSLHPIGALGPLLQQAGIPHRGIVYRGPGGCRSLWELRRRLAAARPEALSMTGHNLLAMLALGGGGNGRRVLAIHFHHTGVKPRWFWWLFYAIATRQFRAITFPSHFCGVRRSPSIPPWPRGHEPCAIP
jgi:hypothetical protein